MKTYRIVYKRMNKQHFVDYVGAKDIKEALARFAAEMDLGAYQDMMDTFRIREISQVELYRRTNEKRAEGGRFHGHVHRDPDDRDL